MPRIFRHYVPTRTISLVVSEGTIVVASAYVGRVLPVLGLPDVVPTWNMQPPGAITLGLLVLQMFHVAGLYDSGERYGRRELFLRVFLAMGGAYLGSAILGFFVHALALGRIAWVTSFAVSLVSLYA